MSQHFYDFSSLTGKLNLAINYFFISSLMMILCRKYLPKYISERSRIQVVLTVHDFISFLYYTYKYIQIGQILGQYHYWQEFTLITLASQYMAHLAVTCYYNCMTTNDLIHHLLTLCLVSISIGENIVDLGGLVKYVFHLSHPAFGARIFLKELSLHYTALYEFVEVAYFIIYIFSRLFGGVFMLKKLYGYGVPITYFLVGVGLWMYVIHHSRKIIPSLRKNYSNYQERKRIGIRYFWMSENPEVKRLSYYKK